LKLKLAPASFVGSAGPAVIDVFGAAVSTVQVNVAGLASVLPNASRARTSKVWLPSARPEYACGLVQAVNAPPSSLQSNVLPASVEVNEKLAPVWLVGFAGVEVMLVSGAVASTVQVWVAAVGSVFPAGSVARTSKV
jgi:hypothetical protein